MYVCMLVTRNLDGPPSAPSPFDDDEPNPFDDHEAEAEAWSLQGRVEALTTVFNTYGPDNGKLPGTAAKKALVDTGVDKKVLRNLWPLADIDKDGKSSCRQIRFHLQALVRPFWWMMFLLLLPYTGCLDLEEFVLAMQLIDDYKTTQALPETLPAGYVPPSKKR